jgi:hypothetical protein
VVAGAGFRHSLPASRACDRLANAARRDPRLKGNDMDGGIPGCVWAHPGLPCVPSVVVHLGYGGAEGNALRAAPSCSER